jgi:hypothetical protein
LTDHYIMKKAAGIASRLRALPPNITELSARDLKRLCHMMPWPRLSFLEALTLAVAELPEWKCSAFGVHREPNTTQPAAP